MVARVFEVAGLFADQDNAESGDGEGEDRNQEFKQGHVSRAGGAYGAMQLRRQ